MEQETYYKFLIFQKELLKNKEKYAILFTHRVKNSAKQLIVFLIMYSPKFWSKNKNFF